jgi:hypothetical protein
MKLAPSLKVNSGSRTEINMRWHMPWGTLSMVDRQEAMALCRESMPSLKTKTYRSH